MYITELYSFLFKKTNFCIENLIKVTFVLLLLGFLTYLIRRSFKRIIKNEKFNKNFLYFLESSIIISLRSLIFIVVLNIFGISMSSLLTLIGAIGVSVCLVFKDSLVSMLSGFIVILTQVIKLGDIIKIGEIEGKIKEIRLMQTILENEKENIVIPNNYFVNNFIKIMK